MKLVRNLILMGGVLFGLWSSPVRSVGEGISLNQTLDHSDIPYESTAVLEVTLTWPGPTFTYLFDRPPQLMLERLKVAQVSSTVSSTGSGATEVTTRKVRFTLKPTSSGLAKIDPATFSYLRVADSVAGSVSTQALSLNIAEPIRVAKRKTALLASRIKLIISAAVVMTLIVGLYIVIRIRNRRPRPVVKSPAELFLDEVGVLRQATSGDLKRFQTGLYKLLVAFLARQYQLSLAGLSTQQMLDLLEHTTLSEGQKQKIAGWLWRAEREKFSPLAPAPGETIRLEAEIREFFQTEMMTIR
jgi:hypothetical protein